MPELPVLIGVAFLVAGIVVLLRREHRLHPIEDDPQRLDTRGPDDR